MQRVADDHRRLIPRFLHQALSVQEILLGDRGPLLQQDIRFRHTSRHRVLPGGNRVGTSAALTIAAGQDQLFHVAVLIQPDAVVDPLPVHRRHLAVIRPGSEHDSHVRRPLFIH